MNVLLSVMMLTAAGLADRSPAPPTFTLVVHGGAGTLERSAMTADQRAGYEAALKEALLKGHAILAAEGSSLDAVEATVRVLEDSPLFNAGKGAVFTHEGRNELDASIMEGATRRAGAVAGVTILRNPISAARAVMDKSGHVMLTGRGAELFATSVGLEVVDPAYFWTERRWKQLQEALVRERQAVSSQEPDKYGTVGAVAVDVRGNLAAATSTGGTTNKRFGRVGDSPVIGAGTWADENCAISATGTGEFFIRLGVAHEIAAMVRHAALPLPTAADRVIQGSLKAIGGDGGVIAVDRKGNIAMSFNTSGMYRGFIRNDGKPYVAVFADEKP